jgi:hypothetical protein
MDVHKENASKKSLKTKNYLEPKFGRTKKYVLKEEDTNADSQKHQMDVERKTVV